jgi:hypothetical protein
VVARAVILPPLVKKLALNLLSISILSSNLLYKSTLSSYILSNLIIALKVLVYPCIINGSFIAYIKHI